GGTVSGVVRNQNGEALPGAKITIINSGTNQLRETVSDSQGAYRFQSVPVGSYEINAEAESYAKPAARKLTLRVNEESRIDLELAVAGTSERVNISAAAPPITESSNSMLGIVIENKQIRELPINGRNFLQLGTMVANVTATASLTGGAEGGIGNGPF